MQLFLRMLLLGSALLAAVVFCATATAMTSHPTSQFADWLFLLPLAAPLLAGAMALVCFLQRSSRTLTSSLAWGVLAGLNVLLLHQAFRLGWQYELLTNDGTAYWGLLSLPALFGGLLALAVGGSTGVGVFLATRYFARGDSTPPDKTPTNKTPKMTSLEKSSQPS